jgi:Tti2 family
MDSQQPWTSPEITKKCQEILGLLTVKQGSSSISTSKDLVRIHSRRILTEHIKPHFHHPKVDDRGHRAAECSKNQDSFYEKQPWKTEWPACVNVLEWCVFQMEVNLFKSLSMDNLLIHTSGI